MSAAFRDVIATTIGDRVDSHTWDVRHGLADAVLAMPEMQAICDAFYWLASEWSDTEGALRYAFAKMEAPDGIADWVVSRWRA